MYSGTQTFASAEPSPRASTSQRPILRLSYTRTSRADPSPKRLARGGLGSIFLGRLHLPGGSRRRIAIKRFNYPVDEALAQQTNDCIAALRRAGVLMPPMLICRDSDGRWVQISPLFGSTVKGSKLGQPNLFYRQLNSPEKDFCIDQLVRVVNAGFMPSIDLFVVFKPPRRGLIPIDLDLIAPEPNTRLAAEKLVKILIRVGESAPERDRLLAVARGASTTAVTTELDELCAEGSLLRRYWNLE